MSLIFSFVLFSPCIPFVDTAAFYQKNSEIGLNILQLIRSQGIVSPIRTLVSTSDT